MSPKIDFTTFGNVPIGGTNGVPTATKEVTYTSRNIKITYTRIGNIVTATVGQEGIGTFSPTYGVIGSVPNGFIPYTASILVCGGYDTSSGGSTALFEFVLRPNNEVAFATGGWSGNKAFLGTVTYITADDFPTP